MPTTKIRKPFSWHIGLVFLSSLFILGCSSFKATHDSPPTETLPVHHVVLVWLDTGTTEAQLQATIDATWPLSNIEGVRDLKVARALPSNRKVVDDSFSFGITMTFGSQEIMQTYLEDPAHIQYLKEHIKGKTEKVIIYDF